MNYMAEHIDVEKIEGALHDYRDNQMAEMMLAQEKARSFFEGYEKAISDIRGMFHCCNYESDKKRTKAFLDGANAMLYELCKELDTASQDIRDMDISIDEKAALIAERIREVFAQEDGDAE